MDAWNVACLLDLWTVIYGLLHNFIFGLFMECFLAIKRNEVLNNATTWMNLEKHFAK
jgi:hypothetical protein